MSAFAFSPAEIDFHMFALWLNGFSVAQASQQREDEDCAALFDLGLLDTDTADHFRMFEQLQPMLEDPESNCCLLELPNQVRVKLTEQFYAFDSLVMREFLNRKFTARARKDWLEEVSETTGVPLQSCLRQYDNIRRLFDAADEIGFQRHTHNTLPPMIEQVRAEFHIPVRLMRSYEQLLFLMCHRFNIKRNTRQSSIRLETYLACANRMMTRGWCLANYTSASSTSRASSPPGGAVNTTTAAGAAAAGVESYSFEFDPALFARFRDFKGRVAQVDIWDDDYSVAAAAGGGGGGDVAAVAAVSSYSALFESAQHKKRFEAKFKPWFRALVACGTGKDVRDFFEDLSELVVELQPDLVGMFKQLAGDGGGGEEDDYLAKLLDVLNQSLANALSPADFATWQMYIAVVWPCVCLLAVDLKV